MTSHAGRRWALLGVLLALIGCLPAAAQWSDPNVGLTDASYVSPTWGYTVRWHSGEWTADRQESANGDDFLQLKNANGDLVRYEGTAQFGDDPAACRKQLLDDLTNVKGVGDLEIVPNSDGDLIWFERGGRAYGLYVFRFTQNGADADWVAWLDCQSLVPDKSVLAISQIGPVDSFDLSHAQAQRVIRSRQSIFPFAGNDQVSLWNWPIDCDAGPIEGQMDEATFDNAASPTPGMKYFWVQTRFYNPVGSSDPLTADASTIFLVDANDVVYWPVGFDWSGAAGDPHAAQQEIAPATGADLALIFELPAAADPARLQNAALGQNVPTLADVVGCMRPRNGLEVRPQEGFPDTEEPQVSFVFAPDGTEQGMVAWLDGTTDPSLGDVVLLDFTNTGQSTWTIDPTRVIAENRFNQPQILQWRPQSIDLDADPASPGTPTAATGPIDLAPGQHVAIRFAFPANTIGCSKLIYVASRQIVPLGGGPCSAGGGAAPIVRTGE
jgi:hypothetical protein